MTLWRDQKLDDAIEMRRQGSTYEEIADAFGITEKTARNWLKGIDLTKGEKVLPKIPDFERKLGSRPNFSDGHMGIADLVEKLQPIIHEDWSIKYLESMNVPSKIAPELMYWYMKYYKPLGVKTPTNLALVYLVSLFEEYPDISTNSAKKIAMDYIIALLDDNEVMKELCELELRFEPWKSKQHMKAWKDYLKLRGVK